MRDIKFRAWNKQEKIMCYKNEDCSSAYWDGVDSSVIELINSELNSDINREEYEFMQYTGLKDKNGKEIYEGDIIRFDDLDGEIKISEVYTFLDTPFCINIETADYDVQTLAWAMNDHIINDIEVIGNIYDNPELLKGEQN